MQHFKDRALIRFRGMVQDMYDPEYYFEKYEVIKKESKEGSMRSGKYMETLRLNVSIYFTFI